MEAPLSVTAVFKSDEFRLFVNTKRKAPLPTDKIKLKKGNQTSRELASFLINVSNLNDEVISRLILRAVCRAYRNSPKLKSSPLVGLLIKIFTKPLLVEGELYTAVMDEKLKEDVYKSYSDTTRNLTLATFHDILGAQLPPIRANDKTEEMLHYIFSGVIRTEDSDTRNQILNALFAYLSNSLDICVSRLNQCPDYKQAFKGLSLELSKKISVTEIASALPAEFSPEELFRCIFGQSKNAEKNRLESCLLTYYQANKDGDNAVYPPIGNFLITLIGEMRGFAKIETPFDLVKLLLGCTYLLITDLLDEENFPRGMTKKFGLSELISALIDGLCPFLLNAADLKKYETAAKKGKNLLGKYYSVEERAEFLIALQASIKSIFHQMSEVLPIRESPLGRIVSLVLNEETSKELRKNILKALQEYYLCRFKGEDSFQTSGFVVLVLACNDTQAGMSFKQLDGVLRETIIAIQKEETARAKKAAPAITEIGSAKLLAAEAATKVTGKTGKGAAVEETEKQATRDKVGVSAYLKSKLTRRDSKTGKVDASPTTSTTPSPKLGKRSEDK